MQDHPGVNAPWPVNSDRGPGSFWSAVQAAEGEPYVWGSAGPGSVTAERIGAMVPISGTVLDDMAHDIWGSMREMMRRDAIRRRAMRRLKVADPARYERLQYLLRLGEAARLDREDREREARRCPTCGCDPEEHGAEW